MARPKGKLFALLAVFAAIGLVTASGAFTSVSAERTTNVTVAGDGSALLQLEPHQNSDNGQGGYADTQNGQLRLFLNSTGSADGSGVNPNAYTVVNNVFNITNQGTQEVEVYIEKTGDNSGVVQFYSGDVGATNITTSGNVDTLGTGDKISVSLEIDTRGSGLSSGDEILSDITIHANATS